MTESRRIQDQLDRSYQGPAWHGPSVTENLRGLTAAAAARHPIADVHSIWEIVHHITVWEQIVLRTLQGEGYPNWREMKPEEDWPPASNTSDAAWRVALAQLDETHRALSAAVDQFPDARLNEEVPGQQFTFYRLIHGAVQHNLYHAGQVGILRKAAGSAH